MSLPQRVLAELRAQPPGLPIAITSLAQRLGCTREEVRTVGERLQHRERGDEQLITVARKIDPDGDEDVYLSWVPLTLNDEPEMR